MVAKFPPLQVVLLNDLYRFEVLLDDLMKWMNLPYAVAVKGMDQTEAGLKREKAQGESILGPLLLPAVHKVKLAEARIDQVSPEGGGPAGGIDADTRDGGRRRIAGQIDSEGPGAGGQIVAAHVFDIVGVGREADFERPVAEAGDGEAPEVVALTPSQVVTLEPSSSYTLILGIADEGSFTWPYADTNNWLGEGSIGNYHYSEDLGVTWANFGSDFPYFLRISATPETCYANCDGSTSAPVLNVNDFTCFLNLYAAADPAASVQVAGSSPGASTRSTCCWSRPPDTCRNSKPESPSGPSQTRIRRFFLAASTSTAPSS
jgi:hypothetical protein